MVKQQYNQKFSNDKLTDVSRILKTIAHPIKLRILQILGEEEPLDVTTICSKLADECQISMLSHHLTKLKDNGIVVSEKSGKNVFYKLKDRHILSIFECIDQCTLI